MGVVWPGCHTPPMTEYASSFGILIRFIANLSLRGAKALAGTGAGELTSFSRNGLRCKSISDSDEYPLTTPSTSLMNSWRAYPSCCTVYRLCVIYTNRLLGRIPRGQYL